MPRLLIVADSLEGGLGAVARRQLEWFLAAGWEVGLVARGASELAEEPRLARFEIPLPRQALALRASLHAARLIRRVTHSFTPDVIHCHGLRSFGLVALAGRRAFVTLHGSGSLPGEAWYSLARGGRALALRLTPSVARLAVSTQPGLTRWTFLPHASPMLSQLEPRPCPDDAEEPLFLWVGRLEPPKSPDLFVHAIALAARRTPLRGAVAGSGSLEDSMRLLASDLKAPVDFLGHCDDLATLYERSRAVALFSRFEGLPLAVEEAMWVGRPVVATRLPGTEWLIGDTGFLVDDVSDAVEAFVALTKQTVAESLGRAGSIRVRELVKEDSPWLYLEARYREVFA